jgi:CRP-like cAMP-binding protein
MCGAHVNDIDQLSQLYLFRTVPAPALRDLLTLAPPTRFGAGHAVFEEGQPADVALLLIRGRLVASVGSGEHAKQVGDIRPGEIVGEQGLFVPGGLRSARVVAAEPSTALLVTPELMDHAAKNPAIVALEQHLLGTLARRIRATNQAIQLAWKADPPAESGQPERPRTLRERLSSLFGGG